MEWSVFKAATLCQYKAWNQNLENHDKVEFFTDNDTLHVNLPIKTILAQDKTATVAWYYSLDLPGKKQIDRIRVNAGQKCEIIKLSKPNAKAQKLLSNTIGIINKNEHPPFYRNSHCPQCHLKDSCVTKLKERDCISLLGGMSPKSLVKYHKRGIFSIVQLSHLYKPRRKGRRLYSAGAYPFELKALAIREQKTYVLQNPELGEYSGSIYVDFEGVDFIYLAGAIVSKENGLDTGHAAEHDEVHSFWANDENGEQTLFKNLFDLFAKYPEATIYHYGSYETKALRQANKKWSFIPEFEALEKRMINILGYLRSHVYPPTYGNGLKEMGKFLGYQWTDPEATGLGSIEWRKNWEQTGGNKWKQKLIEYNLDDCKALKKVKDWLYLLASGKSENVQQVSAMKRHSPYNFSSNPEFGEDYNLINKAAYFDYQHSKIYWRNDRKNLRKKNEPKHFGRGHMVWQPKNVNEIIQVPPLQKCPHCGSRRLYLAAKQRTYRVTDIKFTRSGIKQWILEYHSGKGKCARCRMKYNDSVLRQARFGNNLMAWAVNLYVNYHISFAMISRLLKEQFGIWANPTYFNNRNYYWWEKFKPEVDYCWQIIRNSPVIHIDETTVRLSGKDRGYVWAFATTHTVFYHLTLNREAGFLQEWLKDYTGTIVTDFYPGYETLQVKQQKCLVHLIRDLNDDLFKNPFDEEFKKIVVAFGQLLKKIITTIDRHGLKKHNLKKHSKDTLRFYDEFVQASHKGELSVKYAKRLKKNWENLWTFLQHDGVPWNNNNAEAAIKAFAQHRRSVNGQVNDNGLKEYLSMLTIAQTCRYRNISFLDYLRRKSGIWQNIPVNILPGYIPPEQTKVFAQKLNFKTIQEWKEWNKSGKRPPFISPEYFFIKKSLHIHGKK